MNNKAWRGCNDNGGGGVTCPTSPRRGRAGLVTDARALGEPAVWTQARLGDVGVWRGGQLCPLVINGLYGPF
eukprot:356187-Chlamydomonas_euryale.AAC.5